MPFIDSSIPSLFRPQAPTLNPQGGQWRPPQWNKPAKFMVTVPSSYLPQDGGTVDSDGVLNLKMGVTHVTSYVFDAVLAAEHDQTLVKTHHPVQTGASVSSHAYIEPAQLVLYVLMSDVTPQYTATNANVAPYIQVWNGSPYGGSGSGKDTKSVSAYQQMLTLQSARVPLTVTTRLRTYYNMLILRVSPREDAKTVASAHFRLEFEQLFIANTQATPLSARPNDTQTTGVGTVNVQPPSAPVNNQFGVPAVSTVNTLPLESTILPMPTVVNIPGAGVYSSVPQQFGNSSNS